MIKIELHNSKQILKFHYENLTVKNGGKWTVIDFLNDRITKVAGRPNEVQLTKMYNFLKRKVLKSNNGFSLLTATPIELEKFKNKFEKRYYSLLNSTFTTSKGNKSYREDLLNVFFYSKYDKWNAYQLAEKINVKVCPYCNRSYTFTVGNDSKKGTRFEFDHFFDKASFPYLALSFYNLVPSCHICNSNLKGSNKFKLKKNIHPFLEGFGNDYVFSILPRNIKFIYGEPTSYEVKFVKKKESKWDARQVKKAENNIETFRLYDLYNMHKDYINELIQKSIFYNEDHIKDLYKKYNGTLFSSEDDVKRMVLGNYINEEEYSKRPLSKLTADISKELGIIK